MMKKSKKKSDKPQRYREIKTLTLVRVLKYITVYVYVLYITQFC